MLFVWHAHNVGVLRRRRVDALGYSDVFLAGAGENACTRNGRLVTGLDSPDSETVGQCDLHIKTFPPRQGGHDSAAVDVEAEKLGHEGSLRTCEHAAWIPSGFDPSVIHHHDSLGERERLRLVMGDINGGKTELFLQHGKF